MIDKLKEELKNKDTRIVIMPLNKSINDIIAIEYVNFLKDLPMGYFFASYGDNTEMNLIR